MTFPKVTEAERIRAKDRKTAKLQSSKDARAEVDRRSRDRCEIRIECFGAPATEKHHRRRAGRQDTEANLLNSCSSCHRSLHSSPSRSYEMGLLVHSWDDPAEVEIIHQRLSLVATDGPWS